MTRQARIKGLGKEAAPSRSDVARGGRWGRQLFGLQLQITAAVALGLLALFAAFAAIANSTINESTQAALKERQALASLSAETIDALMRHVTDQMEGVAGLAALKQQEPDKINDLLADLRITMAAIEILSLVDLNAARVWSSPGDGQAEGNDWLSSPWVMAATDTGQPQLWHGFLEHAEASHPVLGFIAVPVSPAGPSDRRVLVGEVHLRVDERGLVPLPQFNSTSGTTVVDGDGRVLASSNGEVPDIVQEHSRLLVDLLARGEAGVSIHEPSRGEPHVVAFAPFQSMSGGVIVEDREDVVLAVPQRLRRNLVLYGSLALVLAAAVAWVHSWHTMRPVKRLTAASREIAAGVLDQPIRIDRNDEIGVLARSFETMRQERLKWEQEMERRVKERTEQVHTLFGRVISAQEEERKRLARELHDQVTQDLAASLIALQRLSRMSNKLQEPDRAALEQAQQNLTGSLKEIRRMISDLRPSALDDLGLEAAVHGFAESRTEGTGIRLHFESTGTMPDMDQPGQTGFFRIVQEAINNTVRHAAAKDLHIRLEFSDEGASATVEDDGRGFDEASVLHGHDPAGRLGILGMQERAALFNGTVDVESQPGKGTRVTVWIPTVA